MIAENNLNGIIIAHGEGFAKSRCKQQLVDSGIQCVLVSAIEALENLSATLFIVDGDLIGKLPEDWQSSLEKPIMVGAEEHLEIDADFYLPRDFSYRATMKNIRMAMINAVQKRFIEFQEKNTNAAPIADRRVSTLAELGIALSAEKNLTALLDRILSEGRKLACCDAASLFLVDRSDESNPQLKFVLAQNASIDVPFKETSFSMNDGSIAGYVASHGAELNIADAYQIDSQLPYQFNPSFDEKMGYRSVSLLSIPMKNYRGEVIGVLQFINKMKSTGLKLDKPEEVQEKVTAFDEATTVVLRALTSQSAVAIENKMLIESIRQLFDGFVQASVAAIEQRDPTTSGHSFRVADLCLRLAEVLPQSKESHYKNYQFSQKDLTSLRYAALLHDFGKVGVSESVLVKPKKLTLHQFEVIGYRVRLTQEHMRRRALETCIQLMKQGADESSIKSVDEKVAEEVAQLDVFWDHIKKANEPTVLPEGYFDHLKEISSCPALDVKGDFVPLITEQQYHALSVPRGSLTEEERDEIQSHVVHTENFLRLIPWTPDLSSIPDIAASHHEKCDGSGYPKGLGSDQIPVPSKIMTVCDIYDALTAADRPYKPAVPLHVAFNILEAEANKGMLEAELVRLFIDAKVHEVIEGKEYGKANALASAGFHHHVCDFDLLS